jgi:hypothetical protein
MEAITILGYYNTGNRKAVTIIRQRLQESNAWYWSTDRNVNETDFILFTAQWLYIYVKPLRQNGAQGNGIESWGQL